MERSLTIEASASYIFYNSHNESMGVVSIFSFFHCPLTEDYRLNTERRNIMTKIVLEPAAAQLLQSVDRLAAKEISGEGVASIKDGIHLGFPVDFSMELLLAVTIFHGAGWEFLKELTIPDSFNLRSCELAYVVMQPFQLLENSPFGCVLAVKKFMNGTVHVVAVRVPEKFSPEQRFVLVRPKSHADLSIEDLEESQHPLDVELATAM